MVKICQAPAAAGSESMSWNILGKGVQLKLGHKTIERLITTTRSLEQVLTELTVAPLRLVFIPQQASSIALLTVGTFQCQGGCADT